MNLPEELKKVYAKRTEIFSLDQLTIIDEEITKLISSGISQNSLQVGDRAPDFTLTKTTGELVESAKLRQSGAVVVSFFRGGWCPYCALELRALEEILPAILELDANLLSISPQTSRRSRSTVEEKNPSHPVLVDLGNQVAKQFGIVYSVAASLQEVYQSFGVSLPSFNGDETYELPVPATFIIDRSGIISYRFVNPDYSKRADPVEIITILTKLKNSLIAH